MSCFQEIRTVTSLFSVCFLFKSNKVLLNLLQTSTFSIISQVILFNIASSNSDCGATVQLTLVQIEDGGNKVVCISTIYRRKHCSSKGLAM